MLELGSGSSYANRDKSLSNQRPEFELLSAATTSKPVGPVKPRVTPAAAINNAPPTRPPNINQWGREGERYQPGVVQQQQLPGQPTAFQHRNPAVQVPPVQPQQLGPRYDYNNFGYQPPQQGLH